MFGYININGESISETDRQTYQSYYCGLCRSLRKEYGARGQMLLNYDMTFLIVVLTGLYEPVEERESFLCKAHPTKRKEALQNQITEYGAAMNVLLAYHNLVDDWKDDRSYTKKTYASMLRKDYEKAAERYPRQARQIESFMAKQAQAESRGEENLDVLSGLTGEMLGELFVWKEDEWEDELRSLGFYLGKFIYLMDAYEDLDRDEKKNAFNPLGKLRKEDPRGFEDLTKLMLNSLMAEAARTFERLPILLHAEILRNILYSGVWSKYEYLQLKHRAKKDKA